MTESVTESRTAALRPKRWSGLAGLLVALFVVAGLVAGYGLGHAPPVRICTEHAVTAPLSASAAAPAAPAPAAALPAAVSDSGAPSGLSGPVPGLPSNPGSGAATGPGPVPLSASGVVSGVVSGSAADPVFGGVSGALGGPVAAVHADAAPGPLDLPGPPAGDVCLCLAVLLTLLALGFSGGGRRPILRLPARSGRVPAPPAGGVLAAPSLAALQVLRL
ncbi:hypothetical protein [Actinomadura sp. WMMB 499]|uniref:hypothetical protein n=1 Tax=Actinomadura sp. WMMB 499 TaxID=1219491 RepID=UPI001246CBC1|nr:hypothetical protein [Actinomadura sp. WMMB 499]QFG26452.1 hypothetical protein F7P10_40260 [Actinomadura sp. WMMB 499]